MYLEDISVGMEFVTDKVTISRKKMLEFSHDYDPFKIHNDEEYARQTRYGDIIAPGVMSFMCVWAEVVKSDLISDELVGGTSVSIEWAKPVYADDVLYGKVTVTDVHERNKYNGNVTLAIDVFNQDDEPVLKNTTSVVVKKKTE